MKCLNSILLGVSVVLGLPAAMANATVMAPYFQTNLGFQHPGVGPGHGH